MKCLVLMQCATCLIIKISGHQCISQCQPQIFPKQCVTSHLHTNVTPLTFCEKLSDNVSYFTTYEDTGTVKIDLPDLTNCINGEYHIRLKLYKTLADKEQCNKISVDHRLERLHSKIQHIICKTENCSFCQHESMPKVIFRYVFTGCYSVEILFLKTGIIHKYSPIFISTNYTTASLKANTVHTKKEFKNNLQKIQIVINSTSISKPPNIYVSIKNQKYEAVLTATTYVKHFDNPNNYSEQFTDCSTDTNVHWQCSFKKGNIATYECNITRLTAGNYILQYRILDEYLCCNLGETWINGSFCGSYRKFNFSEVIPYNFYYETSKHDMKVICIILGAVITFMITAVMLILYRFYKQQIVEVGFRDENDINNARNERFLAQPQQIIVIYTKDYDSFMAMIESFKNLLSGVENTTVLDINTHEEVREQPHEWIRNKITETNVKVILFLNNCSARVYQDSEVVTQWQNTIFRDAVMQLKLSRFRSNFFVTHLLGISDISVFDDLTRAMKYKMPIDIHLLLQDIFPHVINIDPTLLDNFEERCQQHITFQDHNPNYV